jgi:hypothetical protein
MKTTTRFHFLIVCDWAGVRNNRSSSPFERFGDANRAAMKACGEKRKAMRVLVVMPGQMGGDVVAEYRPTAAGGIESVPVG